ncbi:MAG: TolC family protein, partial [Lentisphaeria bacterium]|nr:TolC family protein [Lentisphaeria bacterium]
MTRLYEKTRDLSAKQRDLVDDEYRAGNAELTRLNEAQRDLVQAETNLAASYISIQNAKAQLDEVVGVNTAEYYLSTERKAITAAPGLESYQVSEPKAADADKKEAAKSAAPAKKVPAEKKAAVKQTAAPAIPADPKAKPAK